MSNSDIYVPDNVVYGPGGKIVARSDHNKPEQEEQVPVPQWVEPPALAASPNPEKEVVYLLDDFIIQGNRFRIVGSYNTEGYMQGAMFYADHDGSPHGFLPSDQEISVLFARLLELKGVKDKID